MKKIEQVFVNVVGQNFEGSFISGSQIRDDFPHAVPPVASQQDRRSRWVELQDALW